MLDAPDNAALQVPAGFDFHSDDESTFRALLPASRVDFVDNYIATQPTANILLFGTKLPGSAPDGGEYVATDHAGMTAFYNMTIPATYTGGDGFSYSVLLGTANGEISLAAWTPPAVSTRCARPTSPTCRSLLAGSGRGRARTRSMTAWKT